LHPEEEEEMNDYLSDGGGGAGEYGISDANKVVLRNDEANFLQRQKSFG
jgi:hypothetical protein